MRAEVEVLQPGLFSSIQDLGRFGFREYGVPQSGAMDQKTAALANLLLQNDPGAAVLEMTFQGPKLKFGGRALISISGAQLSPKLDDIALENNRVYEVQAGQVLSFGKRITGYRAYLGVNGGFQTEQVLGSRSWYRAVTKHSRLEKGMKLPFLTTRDGTGEALSGVKTNFPEASEVVEAFPGPEFELLSASEKNELQKCHFSVGRDSDRMGIQLEPKLQNSLDPIITGPVLTGTVQLTPSGTLIALMRDGQTTGGYPRVLQLTEAGINVLAQKMPGDFFQIRLVNY